MTTLKGYRKFLSTLAANSPEKRYNMAVPETLFAEVEEIAQAEGVPVIVILRRFIKIGLLVTFIERSEGDLILRQGDTEIEVMLL